MIYLISGTNRPDSNSMKITKQMQSFYQEEGVETDIIDLQNFPLKALDGKQYGEDKPDWINETNRKILDSDGLVVIVPEYNGSMPGVLKIFIDHLVYPESFYHRPVSFLGLGGMFGGLRPVEHCQQIFGYRNAFIYPDRVFLVNVWNVIKDGLVVDETALSFMKDQTKGFNQFVKSLCDSGLHAKSQ